MTATWHNTSCSEVKSKSMRVPRRAENTFKRILLWGNKRFIEEIYFFVVNTKYISSRVMIISVNSRVHSTSEISAIFNT